MDLAFDDPTLPHPPQRPKRFILYCIIVLIYDPKYCKYTDQNFQQAP